MDLGRLTGWTLGPVGTVAVAGGSAVIGAVVDSKTNAVARGQAMKAAMMNKAFTGESAVARSRAVMEAAQLRTTKAQIMQAEIAKKFRAHLT